MTTSITALTAAGALTGAEVLPVDQAGTTVKATTLAVADFARALPAPADDSYEGLTIPGTAAVALVWGDVVYVDSAGKMAKADADALATGPAIALATGTIGANAAGTFLIFGTVRDDSANAFTPGATVYLSTTAGGYTTTAPSGVDDVIQVLGVALSADVWLFSPQLVRVEHV